MRKRRRTVNHIPSDGMRQVAIALPRVPVNEGTDSDPRAGRFWIATRSKQLRGVLAIS
jgi:hypothetical protein